MVHPGYKHQVYIGLALRQRSPEMFSQPGKGLRGGIGLPGNVGSRGRILQHGQVRIIGTCQRVLAQPADAEVRQPETFTFGHIHRSIEIYQISGRAMCLITGFGTVPMRPFGPLAGKILLEKFSKRFTIIGNDASGSLRPFALSKEFR